MAHAERPLWVIEASVGERDAIRGILCGEIEVETTYRGSTPVAVRHFDRDQAGQPPVAWAHGVPDTWSAPRLAAQAHRDRDRLVQIAPVRR